MQGMFRAWAERTQDPLQPLRSNEDDPELLITIPFNGTVKVKAICLIGACHCCKLAGNLLSCRRPLHALPVLNRMSLPFVCHLRRTLP